MEESTSVRGALNSMPFKFVTSALALRRVTAWNFLHNPSLVRTGLATLCLAGCDETYLGSFVKPAS
jgi:hypothetical protein